MKGNVLAIILICLAGFVYAQTEFPINGANPPAGWGLSGGATINSQFGRTDTYSVQINDDASSLTTSSLNDVNTFQFFYRSEQSTDDYDLIVDYSTDNANWIQLKSVSIKSDPTKSTIDNPRDFKAISVDWNKPGIVRFKVRIKKRIATSNLIVDDFAVVGMTPDQAIQYVTNEGLNNVTAAIRREITEQAAYANYTAAQNRFIEAAENARKNIHLLANLIDKSSGIYLIGGIGDKIATRNQMVNPWSYDKFKEFATTIESKLPEVKRRNLSDILNLVKAPLLVADKVLLGGSLSAFGQSIKSLVGDAFTKTNLKEMGVSSGNIATEVNNGITLYGKVKTFLEVLIKENDKANFLNATIAGVAKESEILLKDSEGQLLEYLQFINMPNPEQEIKNLKTNRISTIQRIDRAVNNFYNAQIGLPASFANNNSRLTPLQTSVLSTTITLATEAEDLRKRYPGLTSSMTSFLNNLKNDSQAPNPFQVTNAGVAANLIDDTTTEKWDQFKVTLGTGLDNLIETFKVNYVQYNLYD